MTGLLSLSPIVAVFPCPNCRETINTSVARCPYCSTPIDEAAAKASAAEMSNISQACSDASYLKVMLGILIPFGVATFFPFLGLFGLAGFIFIKYALPIMLIRWWIKYGRIKTMDPDFRTARNTTTAVSVSSALVLVFLRVNLVGLSL
jgi:hypothetical protein